MLNGIIFPNIYLKDENNEIIGQLIGFKNPDLDKLKELGLEVEIKQAI